MKCAPERPQVRERSGAARLLIGFVRADA